MQIAKETVWVIMDKNRNLVVAGKGTYRSLRSATNKSDVVTYSSHKKAISEIEYAYTYNCDENTERYIYSAYGNQKYVEFLEPVECELTLVIKE